MNWSSEQYKSHMAKQQSKPASKFKNVKVEVDGEKFDSKKELARYAELVLLQKGGDISELKRQKTFHLEIYGQLICKYIADFCYCDKNYNLVVEDVKSKHTRTLPVYRIKKKLMAALLNIEIKEV